MAANRNAWVEALNSVVAFTDELNRRTNSEIAAGFSRESELRKVTFLIGSRGRRLLKAIQVLVPHEWDDVVGNLARSLVEATVDLDYLHTETTIVKNGMSRILTPDVKASLFTTHLVMFERRASGELRHDHEQWYQDAVALRDACAVQQGPYWHGRNTSGPNGVIEELLEEAKEDEARTARLKELHSWFGITSFFGP